MGSIVKAKHRGLTSLTFMQLVPGDDRVIRHICIWSMPCRVLKFSTTHCVTKHRALQAVTSHSICVHRSLIFGQFHESWVWDACVLTSHQMKQKWLNGLEKGTIKQITYKLTSVVYLQYAIPNLIPALVKRISTWNPVSSLPRYSWICWIGTKHLFMHCWTSSLLEVKFSQHLAAHKWDLAYSKETMDSVQFRPRTD